MAIADMFLKLDGVTGEAMDADHKGEIDVVSWSWGMQRPTDAGNPSTATGRHRLGELQVVKRVDKSSPVLMTCLSKNTVMKEATLTVRKAGKTPLEYFKIKLENARVISLKTGSEEAELIERVSLGFVKVTVEYIPQDATGARGGGNTVFQDDAHSAM